MYAELNPQRAVHLHWKSFGSCRKHYCPHVIFYRNCMQIIRSKGRRSVGMRNWKEKQKCRKVRNLNGSVKNLPKHLNSYITHLLAMKSWCFKLRVIIVQFGKVFSFSRKNGIIMCTVLQISFKIVYKLRHNSGN